MCDVVHWIVPHSTGCTVWDTATHVYCLRPWTISHQEAAGQDDGQGHEEDVVDSREHLGRDENRGRDDGEFNR
jgi:hypothetical protein